MNVYGTSNDQSTVLSGKVWLVGAGPGDPDLLTLKALKVIENADLILFDYLVSEEICALFPRTAPAFYVGKKRGNHSIPQNELNTLLIKQAKSGKHVVRLKGGDPFIFGRGGEELLALLNAGVDAEVVPGITSASGCAASAGIPLTHRSLSQGVTLVTAHAEKKLELNWQALVQLNHTLVFYMGVGSAQLIADQLIANGLPPHTPAAIIENGSRENQREIIGQVRELHILVNQHAVRSPAIIMVGSVVKLASQLNPSFIQSIFIQSIEQSCA